MVEYFSFKRKNKISKEELELDEDGNAVFEISVKDEKQVLSPFMVDEKETINSEFASFLDNTVQKAPPSKKIHLKIKNNEMTDKGKNTFARSIKNYYLNRTYEIQRKLKNNTKLLIVMLVMSVLTMTALFLVHLLNVHWVFTEVVDIIAWLFVWESLDLFVFKRSLLIYERQRYISLQKCKITFEK